MAKGKHNGGGRNSGRGRESWGSGGSPRKMKYREHGGGSFHPRKGGSWNRSESERDEETREQLLRYRSWSPRDE